MEETIESIFGPFTGMFYVLFVFFFIIRPIFNGIRGASLQARVMNNGGISIEGVKISVKDYYKALAQRLDDRKIEGLKHSPYMEYGTSTFGTGREYLKIKHGDRVLYYVSSIHVGTSQAFTYWRVTPLNIPESIVSQIPYVGKALVGYFFFITFYHQDQASIIAGMIMEDIRLTIKELTEEPKGKMEFTELGMNFFNEGPILK